MLLCVRIFCLAHFTVFITFSFACADSFGQLGHFPTTGGSSWEYAVNGLTTNDQGTQVHLPGSETVSVNTDGIFHSNIAYSNGNTTTSDTNYQQFDALYVAATRIVIKSKMTTPITVDTTTTTINTYAPPQEAFPSELFAGNVENSTGLFNTNLTTVTVVLGHSASSSSTSSGSQNVTITVAGSETVTVAAGSFPAVKLVKTITTTEGGTTVSYDSTEWYAEGIGLVKQRSQNMDRDLVSYAVNPVVVEISGESRSFTTFQGALDAVASNDILKTKNEMEFGAMSYDRGVDSTFSGGWNGGFTSREGNTTINGSLTVRTGGIVIESVCLR